MSIAKEFFNGRTLISSLIFSLPVSMLFMWRFTSLRHIPFMSADAWKIYAVFVTVNFVLFLFVFFILFWLSRRKQHD
jgi:hypothetical protein